MGYYTYYTFEIHKNEGKVSAYEIIEWIKKHMDEENEDFFYPFEESINDLFLNDENHLKASENLELYPCDICKWYDYDEEMELLAKQFPTVIFELHGDGEDSDDCWNAYYKGDKSVKYYAEIPPLNPKDLE